MAPSALRRNVISLYKFACRNYRVDDDEIFAFGFSRGAFTIRVTIGLILDQGLIPAGGKAETELDKEARAAYRAYHMAHFHTNWWLIYERIRRLFGQIPRLNHPAVPRGAEFRSCAFLACWTRWPLTASPLTR